jgi:hypothetical protein
MAPLDTKHEERGFPARRVRLAIDVVEVNLNRHGETGRHGPFDG